MTFEAAEKRCVNPLRRRWFVQVLAKMQRDVAFGQSLLFDPRFNGLRGKPQYRALVKTLGLNSGGRQMANHAFYF